MGFPNGVESSGRLEAWGGAPEAWVTAFCAAAMFAVAPEVVGATEPAGAAVVLELFEADLLLLPHAVTSSNPAAATPTVVSKRRVVNRSD
jgi:hypothetical protein